MSTVGLFLNCLYKIYLCLLDVSIPLVNHSELRLSLTLIILIGRHSSSNVLSMMNALYQASGLDSSQFVHFNFIFSFAKLFSTFNSCEQCFFYPGLNGRLQMS